MADPPGGLPASYKAPSNHTPSVGGDTESSRPSWSLSKGTILLIDTPIGQYLISEGVLTDEQLEQALTYQKERGLRLGSAVVELGYASGREVSETLARQLCVPTLTPEEIQLQHLDFSLLSPLQATEMRAIPYRVFRRTILVGLEDPHNLLVLSELETMTGRRVKPAVVLSSHLDLVLRDVVRSYSLNAVDREPAPEQSSHKVSLEVENFEASHRDQTDVTAGPLNMHQNERLVRARSGLREAILSVAAGHLDAALAQLDMSLSLDPFDPRVHRHRGRILAELGDVDGAEQAFINALALNDGDHDTWCALAALLESQGRVSDSIESWLRAENTAPSRENAEEIREHLLNIQDGELIS